MMNPAGNRFARSCLVAEWHMGVCEHIVLTKRCARLREAIVTWWRRARLAPPEPHQAMLDQRQLVLSATRIGDQALGSRVTSPSYSVAGSRMARRSAGRFICGRRYWVLLTASARPSKRAQTPRNSERRFRMA